MIVVSGVEEVRRALASRSSIGFVPTMGALHAGHARLLELARAENETVVASIFVNPLQFDRPDDLARYPRTLEADLEICSAQGVDVVFAPGPQDLYPKPQRAFVEVPELENTLCGAFRPGHFRGVCTVVMKLFQIVRPARAYFGEKDAQQLAILRRMALDLNVPIEIVPVATVREPDGLALSSRNRHLSPEERSIAPRLYSALKDIVTALDEGERSVGRLRSIAERVMAGIRVEYFEFVDTDTLRPVEVVEREVLIAGALWLGTTRLIDNVTWRELS